MSSSNLMSLYVSKNYVNLPGFLRVCQIIELYRIRNNKATSEYSYLVCLLDLNV